MAQLAVAAVGAGIGAATGISGATSMGFSIGAILGGILFPSSSGSTEGSRLDDLKVHSSTYGKTIPQVYGTMRFAGNVIWSSDIQETKKTESAGGKGGGATATSYTYSCSFAVGLCRGPVTAIRRIWADTKLIYDASASSSSAMEKYPGVITTYLGSETQDADPTIQSYLGTDDVPAYRGLCYIVFSGLQLSDFGNRIPSIGVEVIAGNASSIGTASELTLTVPRDSGNFDPVNGKIFFVNTATLNKVDAVGLTLEGSVTLPYTPYVTLGTDSVGNFYYGYITGGTNMKLVKVDPDALSATIISAVNTSYSLSGSLRDDLIFINRSRTVFNLTGTEVVDLSAVFPFTIGVGECPMCVDDNGCYWMVRYGVMYSSYDGLNVTTADITSYVGTETPTAFIYDTTTACLYAFFGVSGKILKWSPSTGYVGTLTGAYILSGYDKLQSANIYPIKGVIYLASVSGTTLSAQKINLATLEISETYSVTGLTAYDVNGTCYERFTNSIVFNASSPSQIVKVPLQRLTPSTNSLADIIESLCLQAGLAAAEIDVDDVVESVNGYLLSNRCSIRDAISPLLQSYFVDAVETDGVLKFSSRSETTTPVLTVPYDDLGAKEGSSESGVYIKEERAQSFDLPERIDLSYSDMDMYYEANTQHAKRPASVETGTDSAESVSLALAFSAEEAAQLAEKMLFYAWLYRTSYSFDLPPKYIKLDPADVITVETPLADLTLRLTQVDYGANNAVACRGILESADAFVSTAEGVTGIAGTSEIEVQLPVKAYILDLPKIVNSDDSDFYVYFCFCVESDVSSMIYYSSDRVNWTLFGAGSKVPTNGKAVSALADCVSPWIWDDTNTLQIKMIEGTLASATEEEVLNGANAALLGDEIIQFQNATLISTDTYEISRLLRGRRGTEQHTGDHLAGDRFVLLETDNGLYRATISQTRIGETSYFRSIRAGGNWDDAIEQSFVYNAEAFRCFAPVGIEGVRDSGDDLTITWVRRARWNAEWMSGTDIPLGEATEAYEIDVMNGTTVVRTLTATTTTVVYSAADQITDFGSTQASVTVNIYQLNAIVGRGHAGEATI